MNAVKQVRQIGLFLLFTGLELIPIFDLLSDWAFVLLLRGLGLEGILARQQSAKLLSLANQWPCASAR